MNILFLTLSLIPYKGGISRVTDLLTKELNRRGYACFGGYVEELDDREEIPSQYQKVIRISEKESMDKNVDAIARFIKGNDIGILINQQASVPRIVQVCSALKQKLNLPLITCYHTMPAHIAKELDNLPDFDSNRFLFLLKRFYRRLISVRLVRQYRRLCRAGYEHSDRYILLSESYIPQFCEVNAIRDAEGKITAINNPLSFEKYTFSGELSGKERSVLIVARLEEGQKRISRALEIWRKIEEQPCSKGWQLHIVGDGPHKVYYERWATEHALKQIVFHGAVSDPKPFYQKAAIFMMTSAFEGWGMTIVEALQMGCVPIVFDSFSALHDILSDGVNGYIVPDVNMKVYVDRLKSLMQHPDMLSEMAYHATVSSRRFVVSRIVDDWEKILKNTITCN